MTEPNEFEALVELLESRPESPGERANRMIRDPFWASLWFPPFRLVVPG